MTAEENPLEGLPELLRAVVEGAGEGVLVTDADLEQPGPRILYANRAFTEITGYEAAEVLGRSPRLLQGPKTDRAVLARLRSCLERGEEFAGEAINYRKDNSPFVLAWRVSPIRDDTGRITHFFALQRDVTLRREADQAAAGAQRRLASLVEGSLDIITIVNGEGVVTFQNAVVERILGWTRAEVEGRDGSSIIDPADGAPFMAELAARPDATAVTTMRARHKDGSLRWLEVHGRNLLHDPDVAGFVLTTRDVSDSRTASARLERATVMYRGLAEQIPAVTYIWEVDSDHIGESADPGSFEYGYYTSPRIVDLIGYTREEYDGQPYLWKDLIHPEDADRVLTAADRTERTGDPFDEQYRMRHRDGHWVWVHDVGKLFLCDDAGNPWLLQGVMLDITERHRVQDELESLERRYGSLVQQMPATVYVQSVDKDPERFYISPQVEQLTGYAPERFSDPDFWATIIHPEDAERIAGADSRSMSSNGFYREEYRIVDGGGREVWIHDEAVLLSVEDGEEPLWQGVMLDVTDRAVAEEGLRDTLERFRALAANVPVGIFQTDASGSCYYVNERWSEISGLRYEQSMGSGWSDALHPDDREAVRREWEESAAAGHDFRQEYRMMTADGMTRWVLGSATPVRDAQGVVTGHLGTISDISEQKRAETYLRESVHELSGSLEGLRRADDERRELLDHLVREQEQERAALAEDMIDDPIQKMAAVSLRVETLRKGLSDPKQLGAIDKLGRSVEQATERLRSMLFELRPRTLDEDGLAAALRECLQQGVSEGGPRFEVLDRLQLEPPQRIRAVAYRIAQEAISNALDHAKATKLTVSLEGRGRWFTTKLVDDGIGFEIASDGPVQRLGIAGMRERARLESGTVRVESSPGHGTTVEIRLPINTLGELGPRG
ncbi:MAG: PAS domain S-box protein [Actinomycetota bacterium]